MPFLVHSFRLTTRRAAVATGLYVLLWQGTAHVLMPHETFKLLLILVLPFKPVPVAASRRLQST